MARDENLCPECNGPMTSRNGKYGVFWGCKDFPNCKGTRDSQGRSKKDREEYKKGEAAKRGEEFHPDIDSYEDRKGNDVPLASFNKRRL